MPVLEEQDGMPVDPNHVFVIPPDCTLTVKVRRISI
jgi:chemotaxis response regulator CheB